MADKRMSPITPHEKTVLHGEQLDAAVRELNEFADQQADLIRRKNKDRVYRFNEQRKPDIDALLEESLRAALEDEIVPAIETEGSRILPIEFEREVIKKALAGLRADTLRKIARSKTLEARGGLEDLANRIGRHYHWDREEVARLILENEPEPSEERAHVERLFPLVDVPDLKRVVERLQYVLGRYIRTGIARWFVFEHLEFDDDRVILRGTLRAFNADVTEEADIPSVVAVPRADHTVEVLIDRSQILRVRHGSAHESSAAASALSIVIQLRPLGYVPLATSGIAEGPATALAPASLFMLDLLTARFGHAGLHDRNLTVARFRVDDRDDANDPEATTKPRLRAVRFEGAHLLDSSPACKLLSDEGRALVDVSMIVRPAARQDLETGRFPVRVAIERDHLLALTGFGVVPELSFGVHAAVVDAAMEEIAKGLDDPEGLMALAVRIQERARTTALVEHADMLRDETDRE